MTHALQSLRIPYGFPHELGAARICDAGWQQVKGLLDAGAIDAYRKSIASSQNLKPVAITDSLKPEH
jgi:hypothetical protein